MAGREGKGVGLKTDGSNRWGIIGALGRGGNDLRGVFEVNSGFSGEPGALEADDDLHEGVHSIEDLEGLVRKRIIGRTASDTISKGFVNKAFASAGGKKRVPLTFERLKKQFRKWGIRPSDQLMRAAFRKWDANGNGSLSLDEFLVLVLGADFDYTHKSVYNSFTEEACPSSSPLAMLSFQQGMQGHRPLRRDSLRTDIKKMQLKGCKLTKQMEVAEVVKLIREKIFSLSNSNCAGRTAAIYKLVGRPENGLSKHMLKERLTIWGIHVTAAQLSQLFLQIGGVDLQGRVSFNNFMHYLGADAGVEAQEHPLGDGNAGENRATPFSPTKTSNLNHSGKILLGGRFQTARKATEGSSFESIPIRCIPSELVVPILASPRVNGHRGQSAWSDERRTRQAENDCSTNSTNSSMNSSTNSMDKQQQVFLAKQMQKDREKQRLRSQLSKSKRGYLHNQIPALTGTISIAAGVTFKASGTPFHPSLLSACLTPPPPISSSRHVAGGLEPEGALARSTRSFTTVCCTTRATPSPVWQARGTPT
jgi:hypothetical protein